MVSLSNQGISPSSRSFAKVLADAGRPETAKALAPANSRQSACPERSRTGLVERPRRQCPSLDGVEETAPANPKPGPPLLSECDPRFLTSRVQVTRQVQRTKGCSRRVRISVATPALAEGHLHPAGGV